MRVLAWQGEGVVQSWGVGVGVWIPQCKAAEGNVLMEEVFDAHMASRNMEDLIYS